MSWVMAGWAGALVWSVALVVVDVRSLRLPDALTLPAVPVAMVLAVVTGHPWAVAGGLGWAAAGLVPGALSPRARVGGGDVKLGLSLGTVAVVAAGPAGWVGAVGGASVVTLALALGGGGGRRRPPGPGPGRPVTVVPHGPGMVLATWAVVLAAGYVPAW